MADKRDKTSYIINHPIKRLLQENGYLLTRNKTKSWDGQWLYNVQKVSLSGVQPIDQFTRMGLMDAYNKGVLIDMLEEKRNK